MNDMSQTPAGLTPAGLQKAATLRRRRIVVAALNLIGLAALVYGVSRIFGQNGWSTVDVVILGAFLVGGPWTVMGFWNAMIGLWLLHGRKRGMEVVAPHLAAGETDAPVRLRTAVLMTLRNEEPERGLSRLAEVRRSLNATGWGDQYDVFVLSDTDDPELALAEEAAFKTMRSALGGHTAHYRRRERNVGFKAGNVRDFLDRWGGNYDLFLPLDSDSLMSGDAIVSMTRICQAYPRIGILQSLVVGTPADSAFARIFQFGMRHGMRSFTIGAAWWQGDCGPFWGHNALVRTAPFHNDCDLPVLPGSPPLGGHILSHDQIEAAFMRRAGYEVRVIPQETESWEDNPPTLMDFTQRDLRWCQGNMQYWRLLAEPGLTPTSRFQVFAAIMMYMGAPAWMVMILGAAVASWQGTFSGVDYGLAVAMFFIMFSVSLTPKLVGMLDIALQKGGAARYGGRLRFAAGALIETVFSILLAPVIAVRVTIFLGGLLFGRAVHWNGQNRDVRRLSLGDAARGLWPQLALGLFLAALLSSGGAVAFLWAAPILLGLIGAIPFAVATASPAFGRLARKWRLCAIPDEFTPVESLAALEASSPPAALLKPAAAAA